MANTPHRWTRATVHPDMWVNPADDPRNTDGRSPDGELETYLNYTESYRYTILLKCENLTPEPMATDAEMNRHEDLGSRPGEAGITVRELHLHPIEEYARHAGHADPLRESIDGRVSQ